MLRSDAMLDLTDETGVKVADVKVDLISTLPTDLLEKVDDAVASMAGTTFAAVSGQVDSGASAAQAGYNDAQMIGDCIPALAQALQTAATIVRTVSEVCQLFHSVDLHLTGRGCVLRRPIQS